MTKKHFCCDNMREAYLGDCLVRIDRKEATYPESVQVSTKEFGYPIVPVREGQIYLYNEEYNQISGTSFKYCPYCGKQGEMIVDYD